MAEEIKKTETGTEVIGAESDNTPTVDELMAHIKGPDFPTRATIMGRAEYWEQVSKDSIRKPVEAGAVPPL